MQIEEINEAFVNARDEIEYAKEVSSQIHAPRLHACKLLHARISQTHTNNVGMCQGLQICASSAGQRDGVLQ